MVGWEGADRCIPGRFQETLGGKTGPTFSDRGSGLFSDTFPALPAQKTVKAISIPVLLSGAHWVQPRLRMGERVRTRVSPGTVEQWPEIPPPLRDPVPSKPPLSWPPAFRPSWVVCEAPSRYTLLIPDRSSPLPRPLIHLGAMGSYHSWAARALPWARPERDAQRPTAWGTWGPWTAGDQGASGRSRVLGTRS